MDWRSHFTATWFAEWRNAHLEGPDGYERAYDVLRRAVPVPDKLVPSIQTSGALAAATVRDVYTFGHLIGQLIGRLFALPQDVIAARAEWCGRFNLGISLFDYVADEAGERDTLVSTPLFARLHSGVPRLQSATVSPQSDAARALVHVAGDVLSRLERVVGPLDNAESVDPLWRALEEMMRAELVMSNSRSNASGCLNALKLAARTKSAEPFACVADFMCLSSAADDTLRDQARTLGSAIGECFWLIDDATDLWEDFDRDRWNVFLLLAASQDTAIAVHPTDIDAEIRLSKIVMEPEWLHNVVSPVVRRLKKAVALAPASTATRQEVAGFLATAMQRWLSP